MSGKHSRVDVNANALPAPGRIVGPPLLSVQEKRPSVQGNAGKRWSRVKTTGAVFTRLVDCYLMKLSCLLIFSSTGFFFSLKPTLFWEIRLLPLVSIEMISGPNSLTRLIHSVSGMPRSGHS